MNQQKTEHISINKWVEDYTDDLFRWANYKVNNVEVAEDLVQETFLSAVKAVEKFQGKSSPKTWLMAILNNKIIDYHRKKYKNLEIISWTNNMRKIYEKTRLLLVPSRYPDPCPRVVIEAGISGILSIVSNRGGLPEEVSNQENMPLNTLNTRITRSSGVITIPL